MSCSIKALTLLAAAAAAALLAPEAEAGAQRLYLPGGYDDGPIFYPGGDDDFYDSWRRPGFGSRPDYGVVGGEG